MNFSLVQFVSFVSLIVYCNGVTQSLDGSWSVQNGNASIQVTGQVPGGIYTDLLVANILTQDIFYRNNDRDYRWVSRDDWTYTRTFQVDPEVTNKQNIFLVFHGVDTIADVTVNDVQVGSCDNMFLRYRFSVKEHLRPGDNTISLRFRSPIAAAEERFNEQVSSAHVVPPLCVPAEYQGECHVNHLRKMQASFSWDWGPAFPSVGLWQSVELAAFDSAILRDVTTELRESSSTEWEILVTVFGETGLNEVAVRGDLVAEIVIDGATFASVSQIEVVPSPAGEFQANITLPVLKDQVQLWWPNGYGSQPLYDFSVRFTGADQVTSERVFRYGFRTLQLVQEQVTSSPDTGLSFYFVVNGVPVFAKGSNWIPSHILPERSYEDVPVRRLLDAARVANMNMLRVWGGGLYESDLFYQLADEMGLLIWQDLMFACSMYPASPAFLASAAEEVTQQVRRLQHHPSIALWAGNNENEAALRDNWYGTATDFETYRSDYVKLYVDTIRPVAMQEDPSRSYLASSPSNGLQSELEGFVASNPSNPLYGDLHYYNYLSNGWNPDIYPRGRFVSEFGFQSLPSMTALRAVSEPADLALGTEFTRRRQHHPAGYLEIAAQIKAHMTLRDDYQEVAGFPTYVYLSQINQAMSTKVESETYRTRRHLLESNGQGHTMGALYWQLNDIWQGPSWASVEFGGRWKMLHYFARDFFANTLVTAHATVDGRIEVFLVSDALDTIPDLTLTLTVYKWSTLAPADTLVQSLDLPGASAAVVWELTASSLLATAGCGQGTEARNTCFIHLALTDSVGAKVAADNFLLLEPLYSAVGLQKAAIMVTDVTGPFPDGDSWRFDISLSTDNIAVFVWLETPTVSGYFSANGFLMTTATKTVSLLTTETHQPDDIRNTLTIMSLADTI